MYIYHKDSRIHYNFYVKQMTLEHKITRKKLIAYESLSWQSNKDNLILLKKHD